MPANASTDELPRVALPCVVCGNACPTPLHFTCGDPECDAYWLREQHRYEQGLD